MKRSTRFLAGFAAAVITFISLTAFVGPRYHVGWQYNNYYGRPHYRPYPYQPYRQPQYLPPMDSAYGRPYSPNRHQ